MRRNGYETYQTVQNNSAAIPPLKRSRHLAGFHTYPGMEGHTFRDIRTPHAGVPAVLRPPIISPPWLEKIEFHGNDIDPLHLAGNVETTTDLASAADLRKGTRNS